jgi:uncharacterized protein (DUF4415 family)/uncharacterized DUF497 family protein
VEFEWDPRKNTLNVKKHGIPFFYATRVFLDEHRLERIDNREGYGEIRFITLDSSRTPKSLLFTPCERKEFGSFLPERPIDMKSKRTGIVKFQLDPDHLPELSAKQKARLKAIRARGIDHSDIASQKGMAWTRPGALVPTENKKQITLRLDADLLEFFRKTGKRYQSRINAALREYMNAQRKSA